MYLCFGVGFNDGSRPAKINGKNLREYTLWNNMLKRCYSDEYKKLHPTYAGCEVSDNFKNYSYFYDWCQKQDGFHLCWELDKDLLFTNNKIYSEHTCAFIPTEINKVLNKNKNVRGEYPIGVLFHKASKKLTASISINGKRKHLGLFTDVIDAFNTYQKAKKDYLIFLADKWKYQINSDVYYALINYPVNIKD